MAMDDVLFLIFKKDSNEDPRRIWGDFDENPRRIRMRMMIDFRWEFWTVSDKIPSRFCNENPEMIKKPEWIQKKNPERMTTILIWILMKIMKGLWGESQENTDENPEMTLVWILKGLWRESWENSDKNSERILMKILKRFLWEDCDENLKGFCRYFLY